MSRYGRNPETRSLPPQIHLPLGLSFHDSFFDGAGYAPVCGSPDHSHNWVEKSSLAGESNHTSDRGHRIRRKPVRSVIIKASPQLNDLRTPLSATTSQTALIGTQQHPNFSSIYWIVPSGATTLFLLGLGVAVVHHVYLSSLDEEIVDNQVWINRYSLAMAFIVKAALGAVISIAYTQKIWHLLQSIKGGISISAIDALFSVDESPLIFFSWDMWRNAFVPALMAVAIWLMPFTTLISPTALTVGSSTRSSNSPNCSVPMLEMTELPETTSSLSLFDVNYSGTAFKPSLTSRRIVDSTAQNGRQIGWNSPCGSNCTYNITFFAPSWSCERTEIINDPRAPWTAQGISPWFGGYGDGSNYTVSDAYDDLEYGPIYIAEYNNNTSQFWVGVTDNVVLNSTLDITLKDALDLHIYSCQIMNTVYRMSVNYFDHQQTNDIIDYGYASVIDIPASIWGGTLDGYPTNSAILGIVSLYSPLIDLLKGSIDRDPREIAVSDTSLALVPTLTSYFNRTALGGQQDPYLPTASIGPLLEELSRNLSVSLLSEPRLDTTNRTTTTCTTFHTFTVWKYKRTPLIVAYSGAVGAAVMSLIIGGHALVTSGVARDKSFSSIVRSTRNKDLDMLVIGAENGALPLAKRVARRRLIFSGGDMGFSSRKSCETKRMSFRFVELADAGQRLCLAEDEETNYMRRTAAMLELSQDTNSLSPNVIL